jgi:hypothetical protein
MDQPKQPRGDFVAFLNREKQPGDNRPMFEGRIAKPGTEETHEVTLWAHPYTDRETGEIKLAFGGSVGAVPTGAAPADQIAALIGAGPRGETLTLNNLSLAPRQIVLFPNGFKEEAPDKARPDLWGAYNPGDGSELVRLSVWLKTNRYGKAYMAGATQYHQPDKSEAEMQREDTGLAELVARGEVSRGMPEGGKRARGGRGRGE